MMAAIITRWQRPSSAPEGAKAITVLCRTIRPGVDSHTEPAISQIPSRADVSENSRCVGPGIGRAMSAAPEAGPR